MSLTDKVKKLFVASVAAFSFSNCNLVFPYEATGVDQKVKDGNIGFTDSYRDGGLERDGSKDYTMNDLDSRTEDYTLNDGNKDYNVNDGGLDALADGLIDGNKDLSYDTGVDGGVSDVGVGDTGSGTDLSFTDGGPAVCIGGWSCDENSYACSAYCKTASEVIYLTCMRMGIDSYCDCNGNNFYVTVLPFGCSVCSKAAETCVK